MLTMRSQPLFRKLVCGLIRFAHDRLVQLDATGPAARDRSPYALERFTKAPLTQPRQMILCCPQQIGVGEVQRWLTVLLIAAVG